VHATGTRRRLAGAGTAEARQPMTVVTRRDHATLAVLIRRRPHTARWRCRYGGDHGSRWQCSGGADHGRPSVLQGRGLGGRRRYLYGGDHGSRWQCSGGADHGRPSVLQGRGPGGRRRCRYGRGYGWPAAAPIRPRLRRVGGGLRRYSASSWGAAAGANGVDAGWQGRLPATRSDASKGARATRSDGGKGARGARWTTLANGAWGRAERRRAEVAVGYAE
jgi:hypothetical protein